MRFDRRMKDSLEQGCYMAYGFDILYGSMIFYDILCGSCDAMPAKTAVISQGVGRGGVFCCDTFSCFWSKVKLVKTPRSNVFSIQYKVTVYVPLIFCRFFYTFIFLSPNSSRQQHPRETEPIV